jgi:hypothetical protein
MCCRLDGGASIASPAQPVPMSAQIEVGPGYFITSELKRGEAAELEELFYFNPNQWKIRQSLEVSIQKYGTPQIKVANGKIHLLLEKIEGHQTLYLRHRSLSDRLAGTMVYIREDDVLRILFVALKPEHTMKALNGVNPLIMMFEALKQVGRRIVGINYIVFTLDRRELKLPVRDRE